MRVERLFGWLVDRAVARPRTVLALAFALALAGVGLAALKLELRTSNLDLVDPELAPVRAFTGFAERFGTPNVLVVVLEGEDPAALGRAVERLAPELRSLPEVRGVLDRRPLDEGVARVAGLDPYLRSWDEGLCFLFVQPADERSRVETIEPFVAGVRRVLAAADLEALGVRAGLTGLPQYALDDRDTIRGDIGRLSLLAAVLVGAVFVLAFAAVRRPLAALAALLTGVLATLGPVALYPGHLTLLSAFFASILLGLGVDYGIHVVDRVEELAAEGMEESEAVRRAVRGLARGLATGALTTAAVFFAMQLSGFRGFEELGLIAGSGVLICLLAMVTVLPALLVLLPAGRGRERRLEARWLGRLLPRLQARGWVALLAAGSLAALALPGAEFDTDYLNLQPADSEAVRLEREMVERSEYSPQFAAFEVADREAARGLIDRLRAQDGIGAIRSILDVELQAAFADGVGPDNETLHRMLVGPGGTLAVYAYPFGDVWDPAERAAFLAGMRAIDPQVTGMPLLGDFMVERSRRALRVTAVLGLGLLALFVLLDFRAPRLALLAMAPALLTLAAMGALMRAVGLAFNPLNVMALPVVLGVAVDDGVHVVHRFVAERGDLRRTLAGTGRCVVLTSLTTCVAFGSLALTAHRGLASFALALTLGAAVALALSVVLLPALLTRLVRFDESREPVPTPARLRRSLGAGVVALLALTPPSAAAADVGAAGAAEQRGDAAWAERARGFEAGRLDPAPTEAALAAWREAAAARPEGVDIRFKLLEATYFQGHFLTEDRRRRREIFEGMVALADETLAVVRRRAGCPTVEAEDVGCLAGAPGGARAHFWAAISWGLWGLSHGNLAAAARGVAEKIRDHAAAVVALDREFADAGGLRLLGRLHTVTPKVPFVSSWIDRRAGIEMLREALAHSAADPRNGFFLAEALLKHERGGRDEAIALLEEVSERVPAPDRLVEESETLSEARRLLRETTAKGRTSR